jgi:multidrug efflux pump subunit AcrB
MDLTKAAIEEGARALRPILMTSLAFIFGLLPLALVGVGAKPIGMGAVGGTVGTVWGICNSCVVCNLPRTTRTYH